MELSHIHLAVIIKFNLLLSRRQEKKDILTKLMLLLQEKAMAGPQQRIFSAHSPILHFLSANVKKR